VGDEKQAGNGAKIFVGLGVAIALVTLFLAIFRPMQIQIDNLQVQIRDTEVRIRERIESSRETPDMLIDTLKRDVHEILAWEEDHDIKIEARDAYQWERIRSLERATFNETIPIP